MTSEIMQALRKAFFKKYEQEKLDIDRGVVKRFSRGNVLVQEGHYITDAELKKLSEDGDKALGRLPEGV